ncbi:MAG: hypothetical protein COA79_06495 [Planctomycetota bacterium]|nr:MAG: hypothetical protein COA79_06495 [Planctomycetota bacterium]
MSFNSRYLIKIQSKNQVVMPSKLRDSEESDAMPKNYYLFSEDFIEVDSEKESELSRRIMMYPLNIWNEVVQKMEDRLRKANVKEVGKQIKIMRSSAKKVELDTQNRFTLKKELIDLVGIRDKEVYFVGSGSKVEIWDKASFEILINQYATNIKQTFKDFVDDL